MYAEAANANVTTDIRFNCSANMPNNLTIQEVSRLGRWKSYLYCSEDLKGKISCYFRKDM